MFIRRLSESDAPAVARLWHAGALESGRSNPAFQPRSSVDAYADQIQSDLASGEVFGWGAVSDPDSQLVAYLTAKVVEPSRDFEQDSYLFVLDVDVHADHRQQGLARALLAEAQGHARSMGIHRIELCWLMDDPQSSAVWRRLGVQPYLQRGFMAL